MLRHILRYTPSVALCAAALVSGCAKGDKAADSARIADSIAAANPTPPPAPTPPALTDANILAKLDLYNMADSSAGSLASTKGTHADVKAYGRLMMKDHHAMHAAGMALAKKDSITPAMPAGDTDEAAEAAVGDSLKTMAKGPDWDKFYADHMVAGHEKVLRFLQDASNAAQNADIKDMIQKGTPTVQTHLDKAKELQTKLSAPTP